MELEGENILWICDWFDRCLVSCDKVAERAVITTGNANIHFGKKKEKKPIWRISAVAKIK